MVPEVPPAPGEHARLYGFLRRESGEDFLKNAVGEGVKAVGAAHSFEQVVGVIGAARQERIKRRDGGGNLMRGRFGCLAAAPPHLICPPASHSPVATATTTKILSSRSRPSKGKQPEATLTNTVGP